MAEVRKEVLSELTSDVKELTKIVKGLAESLEKFPIQRYLQLLGRPKKLIGLNLLAGLSWGVGHTIGVTIVLALLVIILSKLEALPIIGQYLAQIAKVIQEHLRRP